MDLALHFEEWNNCLVFILPVKSVVQIFVGYPDNFSLVNMFTKSAF